MDLADAAGRKTAAKMWRSKEFEIAKAMQVAMVFTSTSLATTSAYALFLSQMADGAQTHGPICAGRFNELPIRVAGTSTSSRDMLFKCYYAFLKTHTWINLI